MTGYPKAQRMVHVTLHDQLQYSTSVSCLQEHHNVYPNLMLSVFWPLSLAMTHIYRLDTPSWSWQINTNKCYFHRLINIRNMFGLNVSSHSLKSACSEFNSDLFFLFRFIVAALSPAVVVPSLLDLQDEGRGVAKGIPTLGVAACSLDNVLAISAFGLIMGISFSSGLLKVMLCNVVMLPFAILELLNYFHLEP